MKKSIYTAIIMILFTILTGCDLLTKLNILSSPTPNPLYKHYSPSESSHILLEFDYPKTWVFQDEWGSDTDDFFLLALLDPRGVWDPNNTLNKDHCPSNNCGSVAIIMEPLSSEKSLNDHIESIKIARNEGDWMKELAHYQMNFHGFMAQVLEYQYDYSGNGESSSMGFDRNVIFQVGNKMYWIMSQIPENERGGDFEKGYEYLLKSMKIIPENQK